jgi:acyl dehydratase
VTFERVVLPDADTGRGYACASGDTNPIHTEVDAAHAAGLPAPIVQGMWTVAQVVQTAVAAAGADPLALEELRVELRGYAVMEEPLTIRAAVVRPDTVEVSAEQAGRRVIHNGHVRLATS